MDVVARQHTLHDMDPQFGAGLHDDFVNAVTHQPLQNLVAIFGGSNDVKPVVKSRVSGFGIADLLKPGSLNPLGGK